MVWRQVEMQMWNTLAEDINVDEVSSRHRLEFGGHAGQHRAQCRCLPTIKVGDVGDMALGFKVSEPGNRRARLNDRQAPVWVLPDNTSPKGPCRLFWLAEQAIVHASYISEILAQTM